MVLGRRRSIQLIIHIIEIYSLKRFHVFYHHWGIENSNQSNDVIKDYETNEIDSKAFPSGGFLFCGFYFWFSFICFPFVKHIRWWNEWMIYVNHFVLMFISQMAQININNENEMNMNDKHLFLMLSLMIDTWMMIRLMNDIWMMFEFDS